MTVDRATIDRKLFAALKPGGYLVIADHAALPGQGTSVGKTLHRIEEPTLRQEVEAAGFHVVAEGNFWRNANDTHDYPSYKQDMPIDNFVLKFQKPNLHLTQTKPIPACVGCFGRHDVPRAGIS